MARPPDMLEKHVLITNLRNVDCNDVLMSVSAVVISRSFFGEDAQLKVRGFGPHPAWEIFDLRPKSVEYELEDATPELFREDERFFQNGHRPYGPTKLTFDGGLELTLFHEDSEFELDVEVFEEHRDERPILKVWRALERKVAKYWTAPGIHTLHTVSVEAVRRAG